MIAAENELLYDDDIVGDFLEGQVDDEILYLEEALLDDALSDDFLERGLKESCEN